MSDISVQKTQENLTAIGRTLPKIFPIASPASLTPPVLLPFFEFQHDFCVHLAGNWIKIR